MTAVEKLNRKDYHINFCGTRIEIPSYYSGLVILFLSGSGYGGQCMGDCSFSSSYGVYRVKDNDLILVGTANESTGRDDGKSYKHFRAKIGEQTIELDGYTADDVFKKVFANEE